MKSMRINSCKEVFTKFTLSLFLLSFLFFIEFNSMGIENNAKLKLIKEDHLNIESGSSSDLYFLGKPTYMGPGQGNFAPVLYNDKDTKQDMIRIEGKSIVPLWHPKNENTFVFGINYSHKDNIIGYVVRQFNPDLEEPETEIKKPIRRFICQAMDGRILWQVEHKHLADVRMSQIGTIFIICQDLVDSPSGSSGIYVYTINDGRLLSRFEDPNILIDNYIFSGDNSRLVFEYEVVNWDRQKTEEEFLNPKSHLACMDADGRLLWDIEVKPIRNLYISYHGDRLIYITEAPYSLLELKLGKELYTKAGLIDEQGHILWEFDNPSGVGVDITPSGEYYQMVLYSDQSNMWDITTRKEPVYYCLFELLTHKNVWRKTLNELVPLFEKGWINTAGDGFYSNDRWLVSAFCEKGYELKKEPYRSLLVLSDSITREILYQQELQGLIIKVLMSEDSKVVEILFWDGRRMLFELVR